MRDPLLVAGAFVVALVVFLPGAVLVMAAALLGGAVFLTVPERGSVVLVSFGVDVPAAARVALAARDVAVAAAVLLPVLLAALAADLAGVFGAGLFAVASFVVAFVVVGFFVVALVVVGFFVVAFVVVALVVVALVVVALVVGGFAARLCTVALLLDAVVAFCGVVRAAVVEPPARDFATVERPAPDFAAAVRFASVFRAAGVVVLVRVPPGFLAGMCPPERRR